MRQGPSWANPKSRNHAACAAGVRVPRRRAVSPISSVTCAIGAPNTIICRRSRAPPRHQDRADRRRDQPAARRLRRNDLAHTVDLNIVRRAKGEYLPLASPEDAAAYDNSPDDKAHMAQNRARLPVGKPETVLAKLEPLIESNKADELVVTP